MRVNAVFMSCELMRYLYSNDSCCNLIYFVSMTNQICLLRCIGFLWAVFYSAFNVNEIRNTHRTNNTTDTNPVMPFIFF